MAKTAEEILKETLGGKYGTLPFTPNVLQAMHTYAEQGAKDFAEWKERNYWIGSNMKGGCLWQTWDAEKERMTQLIDTAQLYAIYQHETQTKEK